MRHLNGDLERNCFPQPASTSEAYDPTMATGLAVKRMAKERKELEKDNPDYFVVFKDDDLLKFDAYVVGPDDSLYRHKLVKLHFDIPREYPMKPPIVKFVQHTGDRIHPNLYVDGKVCLSILGTWQGEPWAYSMTVSQSVNLLKPPCSLYMFKCPGRHLVAMWASCNTGE